MFQKGQSGNPSGAWREKPFREALRIELLAIGPDQKGLRKIAKALINKALTEDAASIREIADRMDGKPAQEQHVTVDDKRDYHDWGKAELVAFLNDTRARGPGAPPPDRVQREPDKIH